MVHDGSDAIVRKGRNHVSDLRGVGRLAVEATRGVVDLVEMMQLTIVRRSAIAGIIGMDLTSGVSGAVYGSIRAVTRMVGATIDSALGELARLIPVMPSPSASEAVLAALNGVLGDYLAATANPLAIEMQLRRQGHAIAVERQALRDAFPKATGKILLLVHGSSMGDLQWNRLGHDHGTALERDLGYSAIYLHYNSGLHISTNGRALAGLLETLSANWPVPIEQVTIVAHSMGGLVARSACHVAAAGGQRWPTLLRKMVFLGTPHHGSHWERRGNLVDVALAISPYSAPLARLGKIRSAGVTDLRYGSLLDEDWENLDRFERRHDSRKPLPLPAGVDCYAIAAIRAKDLKSGRRMAGDGVVSLDSALGRHARPEMTLGFPESHQWVGAGMSHVDLLSRREVYEVLRRWLRG